MMSPDRKIIGFAGGGRMAGAMIRGLLASGFDPAILHVADPDESVRDAWRESLPGAHIVCNPSDLISSQPMILILAVKPQQMEAVLREVGIAGWTGVISIAAGVTLARLERAFPAGTPVVRAMPNTPALVGKGMTVIAGGTHADETMMESAERILGAVGDVIRADEELLDAVTAISGSGPAYFFLMMKELVGAAEMLGIESNMARRLVLKTAMGAAELAVEQDMPLEDMIAAVASKGGTTEKALGVFRGKDFGEMVRAAARAAFDRSRELGR